MDPVETTGELPEPYYARVVPRPNRGTNRQFVRPTLHGLLSSAALLVFYFGIITFAQDWQHALQQLRDDRWFVGALDIGFGLQIALFTFLRSLRARPAAGGVVASTGASTGAMLACCAHHLADVLPVVGLSGAAAFLDAYKTPLLWLAILMNLAGIAYLLRQIRRTSAASRGAGLESPSCHLASHS